MSPSGQMARARVRWARARASRPTPKRAGMGSIPGMGLGALFVGIVGLLMLATLATGRSSGSGLSGTGQLDSAGERFLREHRWELDHLLRDARSGDEKRRRVALKRYDKLVKKAPRSVKRELVRHYA